MLLESLLSILIFSLGILALVGFQAASIKLAGDAKQRANASFIANQIESELWGVDAGNLSTCAGTFTAPSGASCAGNWGERLISLPNGKAVVTINGSQVTLTVTWKMPGEEEEHRYVHNAEILHN